MEKYKVINKDACKAFGGPEIVVEKKGSLDDLIANMAESVKEMYRHFYPDTVMVRLDVSHNLDDVEINTIIKSFDETLGKNKQRLRTMVVFQKTVLIFASAKFKEVAEKMKHDCYVEYRNPYIPEKEYAIHEVMSSGVYYRDGYAYIDVRSSDSEESWDEENQEWKIDPVFAIYWRPVGEGNKSSQLEK